jgi:hypothetical protein
MRRVRKIFRVSPFEHSSGDHFLEVPLDAEAVVRHLGLALVPLAGFSEQAAGVHGAGAGRGMLSFRQ